jgi:prepilin-type N-terminal cleavage/methylation domain-containing protein
MHRSDSMMRNRLFSRVACSPLPVFTPGRLVEKCTSQSTQNHRNSASAHFSTLNRGSFISGTETTGEGGFTLIEILVTVTLIALVAFGTFYALTRMNQQASASRLFTSAQAYAQNQLELVESDGPFNPQHKDPVTGLQDQIPLTLQIAKSSKQGVVIYSDPVNDNVIVTGTLTTDVSDPAFVFNGTNLNMRQISVTLVYSYASHNYSVHMSTLRASDL